jgi:hypothetical protein
MIPIIDSSSDFTRSHIFRIDKFVDCDCWSLFLKVILPVGIRLSISVLDLSLSLPFLLGRKANRVGRKPRSAKSRNTNGVRAMSSIGAVSQTGLAGPVRTQDKQGLPRA